jgi:hypothetical protein
LTAWAGPCQPRNSNFLSSRAFVARKNCSNSSRARDEGGDVLQIGLEWGAVRHCKYTIISLFLTLRHLLDFKDSDRSAPKDHAGIGLRFLTGLNRDFPKRRRHSVWPLAKSGLIQRDIATFHLG